MGAPLASRMSWRYLGRCMSPCRAVVVMALLIARGPAARAAVPSEPAPDVPGEDTPPLRKGLVPTGAAVFPGLIVHGTGHFVAGDRKTGWRLLELEGAGLVLTGVGLGTLVATGASRHLSAPIFALPVAGIGLFAVSWLADAYGVSAPAGGTGTSVPSEPTVEARLGTRYVYDPTVRYGTLLGPALDLRWRRLRLSPGAWIATDGGNVRVAVEAAYRPWGPRPLALAADGSFVDVVVGATEHHFRPEAFDLTVLEAGARGRIELRRLAASLAGSFADWGLGLGWALTHYRVGAHETDADGLLLARFGYGVYLGSRGELSVFYDHRHDDYAGGLKLSGRGSGVAGHLGLEGSWFFLDRWGVRVEGQVGSAYLAGLSMVYRSSPVGGRS
jgi:hypothetical protein